MSKIENYLNSEINQRKLCSKCVTAFDYIDKNFNCSFCNNRSSLYCFSCNCCWCSCRNSKCWIYYCVFFGNRNNKKVIKHNKKQKEKHDKILILFKSKVNSTETLVCQALIDMEISHEQHITILKEKDKYKKMKENLRNVNGKLEQKKENMRMNNVNSRT